MELEQLSKLIVTGVRSVAHFFTPEGVQKKRHRRSLWGISFKYEGESAFFCGNEEYLSNAENLMILPKGSSYVWKCTKPGHSYMIEFDCSMESGGILSVPVKNADSLKTRIQKLEQSRINDPETAEIRSIAFIYQLLLSVLRDPVQKYIPSRNREIIAAVIDYIAAHYDRKLSNDELSRIAGVSTGYFRKLFTETTGSSPMAYVQAVKIRKAKEMLSSDYSSVTDVALSLGFQNVYDFSRTFKRITGLSPLKYRETRFTGAE